MKDAQTIQFKPHIPHEYIVRAELPCWKPGIAPAYVEANPIGIVVRVPRGSGRLQKSLLNVNLSRADLLVALAAIDEQAENERGGKHLTKAQQDVLTHADRFGIIRVGDDQICPEIHFCPDWDQMPICADSPEAEACTCGRIKKDMTKC